MGYHACDQVWQTAELRDEILLCLPVHQLLTMRRVCRSWYDSRLVNQVLFLNPGQGPRVEYMPDDEEGYQWMIVAGGTRIKEKSIVQGGGVLNYPPFVNPILRDLEWLNIDRDDGSFPGWLVVTPWRGHLVDTSGGDSFLCMQFTYPPARKLSFTCLGDELVQNWDHQEGDADQPEDSDYTWFDVTKDTGVTIRDLIEAMRVHLRGCRVCLQEADDSEYVWRVHGSQELGKLARARPGHRVVSAMRKRTIKKETGEVFEEGEGQSHESSTEKAEASATSGPRTKS